MGNFKLLTMKLLANGLPLFPILLVAGDLNWLTSLIVTLVIALVAYAIGDVFILPAIGNLLATLADGALVFAILYLLRYFDIVLSMSTMLYAVAAVLLVEGLFIHPYIKRLVTFDAMGPYIGKRK